MFIAREFKGVSLFKTIFIGIQSLYNAVLVSASQQ